MKGTACDSGGPSPRSACGDCPDPIPECQEGEALTVDRNTTELCCPLYQCGECWLDVGPWPEGAPGALLCVTGPLHKVLTQDQWEWDRG